MAPALPPVQPKGRQRKTHTKSRRGCKNCKLRSVKCDETKPNCERCMTYGAICNYTSEAPDLEMAFNGSSTLKGSTLTRIQKPSASINQFVSKMPIQAFMYPAIYSQDFKTTIRLSSEELDRLGRFQTRTVMATGSPKSSRFFQSVVVELAVENPCLMHVIQTLTGIHDRYLSTSQSPSNSRLTISERYHLGQAAKLLNDELSNPIQPHRRDALWATAALLGATAWATIEASKPEEAWPLSPPDPADLEWIKMSENKAAIWDIAQPLRPDSVFYALAEDYQKGFNHFKDSTSEISTIPKEFIKLYELDDVSNLDHSPYFAAVQSLSDLLPLQCSRQDMTKFIAWITHLKPGFKYLLENKDPRALLLLSYWYMKVGDTVWSLDRRSKLECQAICIYLEKYHWHEFQLHRMLKLPKKWCGVVSKNSNSTWEIMTGQDVWNTGVE